MEAFYPVTMWIRPSLNTKEKKLHVEDSKYDKKYTSVSQQIFLLLYSFDKGEKVEQITEFHAVSSKIL